MAEIVFPDELQDASDQQKYDTYQRNKELHFLQMRNNLRNSFMNHNKKKRPENVAQRSKSGLLGPQLASEESSNGSKAKPLNYSKSRDNIGGQQSRGKQTQAFNPLQPADHLKADPFSPAGRFGDLKLTFNSHLQMEESSGGDR